MFGVCRFGVRSFQNHEVMMEYNELMSGEEKTDDAECIVFSENIF